MRIYLILILSGFASLFYAQDQSVKMSDVEVRMIDPSIEIEERLKLYSRFARLNYQLNPKKTLDYVNDAIALVDSLGTGGGIIGKPDFILTKAIILIRMNKLEESKIVRDRATSMIAREENSSPRRQSVLNVINARIAERDGDCVSSKRFLDEAIQLANEALDTLQLSVINTQFGRYYRRCQNRNDSAVFFFIKASRYYNDNPLARIIHSFNIAGLNMRIGNDSTAIQYYNKILDNENLDHYRHIQTRAEKHCAFIYRNDNKLDLAEARVLNSIRISKEMTDKTDYFKAICEYGIILSKKGETDLAIERIKEAQAFFIENENKPYIVYCNIWLSNIFLDRDFSKGEQYYKTIDTNFDFSSLLIRELEALKTYSYLAERVNDINVSVKAKHQYLNLLEENQKQQHNLNAIQIQERFNADIDAEIKEVAIAKLKTARRRYLWVTAIIGFGLFSLLGLGVLLFNIKQEDRFNTELEKRSTALQELMIQLEKKNSELAQFAFTSSHDLKTPLLSIIGFADYVNSNTKSHKNSKIQKYSGIILASGNRLKKLIDAILRYSTLSSHRQDDIPEPIDLEQLVNRVIGEIKASPELNTHSIRLEGNLPFVMGVQQDLYDVFYNLLENAILYNTSDQPEAVVRYHEEQEYAVISITDNGIGIRQEHYDDSMKMFIRLHNYHDYPGTGLGLPISEKIISYMGGEITIDSTVGVGSTFSIRLPKSLLSINGSN